MTQTSQAIPDPAAPQGGPRLTAAERAALIEAKADTSAYGRWGRRELTFGVAGSEHVGDVTRVRVTYQPASGFRGRPGERLIVIDAAGEVVSREQLHPPQEAFPWVLATLAGLSAIAAAVIIPLIIINPVKGDPLYVPGRILWMRVTEPSIVPAVQYQNLNINGTLSNFGITPSSADVRLAVMQVTLINQQSHEVVVVVDEDAASLLTDDGQTIHPINTVDRSISIESVDSRYAYAGFVPLWTSVDIKTGEQVSGMLVFEVPPGARFTEFRWDATDSMVVRF